MNRRNFVQRIAIGGLATGFISQFVPEMSAAQDGDVADSGNLDLIDRKTQQAIDGGLQFLAERLNQKGAFNKGPYSENVAVVSLAGLAFLSEGSVPGQGTYSEELRRTLDFVLARCKQNGFITTRGYQSHGPMYGHGFATLFLAEIYGTAPGTEIREKLKSAVQLIIDTQNDDGGWRYQPQKSSADISVSICQIMALRAARNAGIYVPNETIDRCVSYVKKSQNADGGFMYLLEGGESAFPRSAAGLVALFSAGIYEGNEIEKGLQYLKEFQPGDRRSPTRAHYFYGHYYAVQAMWHAGGEHWAAWYPAIRDDLLRRRQRNGAWLDGIASEYATAMACIILQMPNNYLPIFQR